MDVNTKYLKIVIFDRDKNLNSRNIKIDFNKYFRYYINCKHLLLPFAHLK